MDFDLRVKPVRTGPDLLGHLGDHGVALRPLGRGCGNAHLGLSVHRTGLGLDDLTDCGGGIDSDRGFLPAGVGPGAQEGLELALPGGLALVATGLRGWGDAGCGGAGDDRRLIRHGRRRRLDRRRRRGHWNAGGNDKRFDRRRHNVGLGGLGCCGVDRVGVGSDRRGRSYPRRRDDRCGLDGARGDCGRLRCGLDGARADRERLRCGLDGGRGDHGRWGCGLDGARADRGRLGMDDLGRRRCFDHLRLDRRHGHFRHRLNGLDGADLLGRFAVGDLVGDQGGERPGGLGLPGGRFDFDDRVQFRPVLGGLLGGLLIGLTGLGAFAIGIGGSVGVGGATLLIGGGVILPGVAGWLGPLGLRIPPCRRDIPLRRARLTRLGSRRDQRLAVQGICQCRVHSAFLATRNPLAMSVPNAILPAQYRSKWLWRTW